MLSNKQIEEWIKSVIVKRFKQRAEGDYLGEYSVRHHPSIHIQQIFHQLYRPTSPIEIYSDKMPRYTPQPDDEDGLIPIDEVLGSYDSDKRMVVIYIKNVEKYAKNPFQTDADKLKYIVELHEYAHALVHLGVYNKEDEKLLRGYNPGHETDWEPYLSSRNSTNTTLDLSVHEFLAQLISWKILTEPELHHLQNLFLKLMKKQPKQYRMSKVILERVENDVDDKFRHILNWAQNHEDMSSIPTDVNQREAIESLLFNIIP